MGVNGGPEKFSGNEQELEGKVEYFPVGLKLSELVAKYCDNEVSDRLKEIVISRNEKKLPKDFYAEMGIFSKKIIEDMENDWQKAIGTEEVHPLQLRQQVLLQVGQIVILLDTYWKIYDSGRQDLAEVLQGEIIELREELLEVLEQLLVDESLLHRDYFESVMQKVGELTASE